MDRPYYFLKKITVLIIFFIVFFYGLQEAQKFLVPLCLGALFSYLLYPLVRFQEKNGIPRILANIIAIITGVFIIALFISYLSGQFAVFVEDFPRIRGQASENLRSLRNQISSVFGVSASQFENWAEDVVVDFLSASGDFIQSLFTATTSTIVRVGLMPVFIFFMLYYRNKFHNFIIDMLANGSSKKIEKVLSEVNKVAQKYMTGVFLVVIILSISNSVALSIIGMEYAILLGITAAIFNFIPYFGTLIGAIFPLLYALLAMQDPTYAWWVLFYFLFIQFVENNILTPNITGGIVRLNPFVTILSLIVGSMVWGIAGMFLVVPFLAITRILCENINSLQPVGYLLSKRGTEEHAITWGKIKSVFTKTKKK